VIRVLTIALLVAGSVPANALPRFAAQRGAECTLCHVSPSGGGVRNRYGSNIFQRAMLPIVWGDEEAEGAGTFSGELAEWLTIGADLRLSYIYSRPERAVPPADEPAITSSLFLMQADLYTAASLAPYLSLVLDVGVYAGFEAWFLLRTPADDDELDVFLKVGRFLPAFGVRDPNHDLFTRAGIGLGATDRDSGLELTVQVAPLSVSFALVNGTVDDALFDTHGGASRSFEKAIVSRAALRFSLLDALFVQTGASLYLNDNTDAANPLFDGVLGAERTMLAGEGVDELRAGAFVLANLGRFTYLGDVVYVRDAFAAPNLPNVAGYASYQELDVTIVRGVELGATLEFADRDVEISDTSAVRFGIVTELFLTSHLELRAMARRTISDRAAAGALTDFVLFAHAFF
jgi:hypothetical protein